MYTTYECRSIPKATSLTEMPIQLDTKVLYTNCFRSNYNRMKQNDVEIFCASMTAYSYDVENVSWVGKRNFAHESSKFRRLWVEVN